MKRILNLTCAALVVLLAGCESSTPAAAAKTESKADPKPDSKGADTTKPAPTATTDAATPQKVEAATTPVAAAVTSWKGSAPMDTSAFSATAADWNIHYVTHADSDQGAPFQVYVIRADSGRNVALAVNAHGNTDATASVRTAPGMYYLKVAASTPWTIEVTGLH